MLGYALDSDRQDMIELVYRTAVEDCDGETCAIAPVLRSCVDSTVTELMDHASITTYVPLLAMRGVKECIRRGSCDPVIVERPMLESPR